MEKEYFDKKADSLYSKRLRAGKRRTYFFDVRSTKGNDYYLTITESRKRFDDNGYERHKIFLYKEDFNKFLKALGEAIDYVKTDIMPDFDFDSFNYDEEDEDAPIISATPPAPAAIEEEPVDTAEQVAPPAEAPDNDEKVIEVSPKTSEDDTAAPHHEDVEKW
ncbi:MAG: DUF3276 family protein [Niabella sp.]